jgi:hypothetical protein
VQNGNFHQGKQRGRGRTQETICVRVRLNNQHVFAGNTLRNFVGNAAGKGFGKGPANRKEEAVSSQQLEVVDSA